MALEDYFIFCFNICLPLNISPSLVLPPSFLKALSASSSNPISTVSKDIGGLIDSCLLRVFSDIIILFLALKLNISVSFLLFSG